MLSFIKKSIFDINAQVYVNPVNCQGISGAGLALEFKNRYPDMFDCYEQSCKNQVLKPGGVCIWTNPDSNGSYPSYVWCVATMYNPGYRATNIAIKRCLTSISELLNIYTEVNSIAMPAIGCGIGRFKFDNLREMIITMYNEYCVNYREVDIYVCEPK